MSRPLVSVVTGTYQRHDLLMGAIENVQAQTYRPLEHVIVADGPDPELPAFLASIGYDQWSYPDVVRTLNPHDPIIRFTELGFWSSGLFTDSVSAAPFMVAQLLARGEYQMWMADDERMEPDHIESLVDLLESEGADFAYSRVRMWWVGRPEHTWEIGTDPPQLGQITNVLYRADLLKRGLYPLGAGMTSDWTAIQQWMQRGATWAYSPRVTFSHRADH